MARFPTRGRPASILLAAAALLAPSAIATAAVGVPAGAKPAPAAKQSVAKTTASKSKTRACLTSKRLRGAARKRALARASACRRRLALAAARRRDVTAPETTITSGPSGTVAVTGASFGFASSESRSTFQCSLDGGGWTTCSSPRSYSGLAEGSHTFRVRARDKAGNVDATPAARSWTVSLPKAAPAPAPAPTPAPEPVTAPVSDPVAVSDPAPAPTDSLKSITVAPKTAIRTDADAASRVRRSSWEPRPGNATANRTVPTAEELGTFRTTTKGNPLHQHVTGNFTGTTDEIIQWAAWKWGLDEDLVRAELVAESWWNQDALGDRRDGVNASLYPAQARISSTSAYESMSIAQIKWRPDGSVNPGSEPLRWKSTAFAVDYYGATIRYYYDGYATWLNDACCFSGVTYKAGDIWGSVGAYFAGRWYTSGAQSYIDKVKNHMSARTWAKAGF